MPLRRPVVRRSKNKSELCVHGCEGIRILPNLSMALTPKTLNPEEMKPKNLLTYVSAVKKLRLSSKRNHALHPEPRPAVGVPT